MEAITYGTGVRCDQPGCGGSTDLHRTCGARICSACGTHVGLDRCFCGWTRHACTGEDGRSMDGRQQLIDMGEVIEPDDY
jgi:hypothetical protein